MTQFIRAVGWLSRLFGLIAAVLLVAAVLVVNQLVFVRYVLGESAIWQHEFVTFSLIGATFIGCPYLLLSHGHVNVDLMPVYLGRRGRVALSLLASCVALAFCLIVTFASLRWWHEAWANGWRAETVWSPPLWIPYLSMPLGIGLLALQYVADILALLTGRAAPFGLDDEVRT